MAHLKKILIDTKCGRIFEARQHLFREMASPIQYSPGPWISLVRGVTGLPDNIPFQQK